jgi:hypothetical protein
LPQGIGQYDDFHTIDWQREMARDRMRHRLISSRHLSGSCFEKAKVAHDAWSGWLCVLLVGCVAGENVFAYVVKPFLTCYKMLRTILCG